MIDSRQIKIAIASGKGGTGKTLVATHLADALSQTGSCILADLDVEEPNAHLFFPLLVPEAETPLYKPIPDWQADRCTHCGLCAEVCAYHAVVMLGELAMVLDELCHSCFACSELCPTQALPMKEHEMGTLTIAKNTDLQLFTGKLRLGEEQAVPVIKQTISQVEKQAEKADFVIYDSPPGTSCPVVAAVNRADLVILVTEPTPFGLNDFKLAVETMTQLKKPIAVVINRDGIGNDDVAMYCQENQLPVIARIQYHEEIAQNYAKGVLSSTIPEMYCAMANLVTYINSNLWKHA